MVKKQDFKIVRGDTKYIKVILDSNFSVNDYKCKFTVKELDDTSTDDTSAVFQATSDNGLVTTDTTNNQFIIKFDSSNLESKTYKYDIQFTETSTSEAMTVLYGFIYLIDDVTKVV